MLLTGVPGVLGKEGGPKVTHHSWLGPQPWNHARRMCPGMREKTPACRAGGKCAPLCAALRTRALRGWLAHLRVGAVLLPALSTGEQVCLCATRAGHLVLTDGLLGHGLADLLQLIAGHVLQRGAALSLQPEGSPAPPTGLTSDVITAICWGVMAPHSTFRRRSGFLASLRLEMRLRTRFLYFMSVFPTSRKMRVGG